MQIKIVEVGKPKKENKHFILPVKYVDMKNDRTFDRNVYSFATDTYKVLKDAKEGELYNLDLKKDDNGYWQWENVTKQQESGAGSGKASEAKATMNTVRSTYETPEERAKRQLYITRQWSVNASIEFHKLVGGEVGMADVVNTAKAFEQHVYDNGGMEDTTDDKPWENE